jgi:hypothetical protein
LYEAFWRLDVVPQIDEMVRQRVTPGEFARYMRDPERPAFLQVLRAHEIGGRAIPDLLDAITAEPFAGARSIAGVLHGRAGKEPAPARGETTTWAERLPRGASPEITTAGEMLDTRQVALGERLAANPPEWAADAWGVPPAEPGALRDEWVKRAALVGSYREAVGITDPRVAIGPVPSGKAHLGEAYLASVRALELPDEAALLRAMGRGDLEARVQDYIRAEAVAPPDVQAEVGDVEHGVEAAREDAREAVAAGDVAALEAAQAKEAKRAAELSRLSVADAARREWREATAEQEAAAREAAAELRRRGAEPGRESGPETEAEFLERLDRIVRGSEAEPAPEAAQEPEASAAEPAPRPRTHAEVMARIDEIVAADAARKTAEARRQAEPQAREPEPEPERAPQAEPEPEPEAEAGEPALTPERAQAEADSAEIDAQLDRIDGALDRRAEREAERLAELEDAAMRSAEAEAQASAEAAWQPGTEAARDEAAADFEPELEM